jgi:hypothetical protein
MKIGTIVLASAFALSSSLVLAQAGGNYDAGPTVRERGGPAVEGRGRVVGPEDNGRVGAPAPDATTGMAPPTAPSGPGLEPGARDESRPGGRGVSDRPGD